MFKKESSGAKKKKKDKDQEQISRFLGEDWGEISTKEFVEEGTDL